MQATQAQTGEGGPKDELLADLERFAYLQCGYRDYLCGLRIEEDLEYEELELEEKEPNGFSWAQMLVNVFMYAFVGFAVVGVVVTARWLVGLV